MRKRVKSSLICPLLAVLFVLGTSLQAAEIKGVGFEDHILVEGTPLRIQGVALMKWAGFINVYAGALYLPENHSSEDWNTDISKSLELSYFHGIKAADFASASDKLLKKVLNDAEYASLSARLKTFYALFRDVEPGDRYRLIYLPGRGTELHLNDELLGTAPGADFAGAYFGIWLGEKPISKGFRDHLLAGGTENGL
ncbi:chalcone isomerase family protein [Geopsychrobacter electrodiphilus]|uniref:chalcone isomerase family protein n=1 Tax=Geopsychrobacter electrodiphilus TaxID=225196 RepID=UPI0003821805|nr:chalcone isomerase family protein [Geopsychrobacter electrodiphilus]